MKKSIAILLTAALGASLLTGCVSKAPAETTAKTETTEAKTETAADTTAASTAPETSEAESAPDAKDKSYTIGIGQFAEHGSLDNCREGFILGLKEAGIEEGKNLTIIYENSRCV